MDRRTPTHCDGVTRPRGPEFDPNSLYGSVIAVPLLELMARQKRSTVYSVVIDLDYRYPYGLDAAAAKVNDYVEQIKAGSRTKAVQAASPRVSQ